jgi:hypothetical protein
MNIRTMVLLLCLAGCAGQKQNDAAGETPIAAQATLVLDSLLAYDSEQALIQHFGAANISRDTAWLPEGMGQYMVTVLYPGTRNEVMFEWSDSATYSTLDAITVSSDSSAWMSNGVNVGTNMMELIELNGGDFSFSGFGWDHGGNASFGDEGRLRGLNIVLESSEQMMAQEQQDSLMGDQMVSTKSTAARLNNPLVRVIRLVKERD